MKRFVNSRNRSAEASLLICLAVFLLSGCSILKPGEDPSRYYRLRSVASEKEGGALAKLDKDLSISVGPATIPDYLDRQGVVSLLTRNELSIAEYDLWGEGLDAGIARVIAQNLRTYLGTLNVMPFPEVSSTTNDIRVPVFISRFELNTEGVVELKASWSVLNSPGSDEAAVMESTEIAVKVSRGERTADDESAQSRVEEQVEAMSHALDELSRKIAQSVETASGR